MKKLPVTLSPITLDYPITTTNSYTSHATPILHATRDTLISDGGAI